MRAMTPLAAAAALAVLAACSTPRPDPASTTAAPPVLERWAMPAPASTYVAVQHDDRQVQPAEFRLCDPGLAACPVFSRKVYDIARAATAVAAPPPKLLAHRIYFAFGSSALDDDARAAITALLPKARAGRHIVVEGRTDPRGSPRSNARLAVARAAAVRAALLAGGVPADRVEARAAEPCCDGPLPSTESDYAERRRASVSISITPLTNKDS